jgi:hypothetical protein
MEGGDPSPQPSPLSTGCIVAGSWGAGLPSFWCAELKTEQNDHRQYLVREEHAAQFGAEFPECAGSNILSVGQTIAKATHEAKLTTVQRPAGYVCNTQAARPQRFVNERVQLTAAGQSDLARGVRKNQIVWGFRYRCGGINTYVCVSDTALSASTDAAARSIGRTLTAGTVIVAGEIKQLSGKRWIRIGHGWACTTDTVTGAVKLRAAGCERQCGGICVCTSTCTNQKKSRHGCSVRINYERTLSLVQKGLVRITVIGQHAPDLTAWAPLPPENRAVSTATRQAILQQAQDKRTAKTIQKHLNLDAREAGSPTDGRGAVVDRSVVPGMRNCRNAILNHAIQKVIENHAKA